MNKLTEKEEFLFSKKIKKEEEKLFIMRYQVLNRSINGLTESFIVNLQRLKELLSANNNKKFCKFYYLQKNDSLTLGLHFSDDQELKINEEEIKQELDKGNQVLFVLDGEFFIEKKIENFTEMIAHFDKNIGNELSIHTKTQNSMISYNLEIVDFYITSLELHFNINYLKFNMFQYRSTDIDGTILANFETKNNRIAFCVHALINNLENKNILAESEGYDLGNLKP